MATLLTGTKPSGPGTKIGGTKNNAAGWAAVRAQRDILLSACDWTQMPDAPLDAATKLLWATYRQALRDVTEAGHVAQVVWPTPPAKKAPVSPAEAGTI